MCPVHAVLSLLISHPEVHGCLAWAGKHIGWAAFTDDNIQDVMFMSARS